jgi:hypothetical protein
VLCKVHAPLEIDLKPRFISLKRANDSAVIKESGLTATRMGKGLTTAKRACAGKFLFLSRGIQVLCCSFVILDKVCREFQKRCF